MPSFPGVYVAVSALRIWASFKGAFSFSGLFKVLFLNLHVITNAWGCAVPTSGHRIVPSSPNSWGFASNSAPRRATADLVPMAQPHRSRNRVPPVVPASPAQPARPVVGCGFLSMLRRSRELRRRTGAFSDFGDYERRCCKHPCPRVCCEHRFSLL